MSSRHEPDTSLVSIDAGPGATVHGLLEPGVDRRLGVARATGSITVRTGDAVMWVLLEGGRGTLKVGDDGVVVAGRDDVFSAAGWSVIVGPHQLAAVRGEIRATLVWRAESRAIDSRVIDPSSVGDETRGEGATRRRVRTYVATGPLIVGETLNPPGLWSSYPPHRHAHEEIYLYRFDPPDGFGLQMRSDSDDDERAVVVRDGRVERITSGWHPVVAAPGATMYYLWALAGDTDTVDPELDPRYG